MDSESLDQCIQRVLSALYPPFQATSSTVLCQVLNVVESYYQGDGLRYLIHFLLPTKQFLQNLQQHACLLYCGLLFHHEGWPLCLHEKVVIQLCPLDQRLLRPGDFYLLVAPVVSPVSPQAYSTSCRSRASPSPHLLACSLSPSGQHVEELEVSELALRSLFSMAWLDSINREREERGASRLERCLLSTHRDVFRVPWEDLVYPQFISQLRAVPRADKELSTKDMDMLIDMSDNQCEHGHSLGTDVKLLPSCRKRNQSPSNGGESDSEGEYVELVDLPLPRFSPQKGSLTQSISQQYRARTSIHTTTTATHAADTTDTPHTTHTHSSRPASQVDRSSHMRLCSGLTEESLNNSCRPVVLIPLSPPSPPPAARGESSRRPERRTSLDRVEGTGSGQSSHPHTEPQNCMEQTEEELEKGKEEVENKHGEEGERKETGELEKRQGMEIEMVVLNTHSVHEGGKEVEEERAEEVEELEEVQGSSAVVLVDEVMEARRDEVLAPCMYTAGEEGELEKEGEPELEEEKVGEEEEREEEVEVEEEFQIITVQQSQDRKEESHTGRGGERAGAVTENEETHKDTEGDKHTHTDPHTDTQTDTHTDTNSKIHTDPHTDTQTDTHTDTQTDTHTDTNSKIHTDPHNDTQTDTHTDTNSEDSHTPHTYSMESNSPQKPQSISSPVMHPYTTWAEAKEPEQRKEEKEKEQEEEEECGGVEVGGGRTPEPQTEGPSSDHPPVFSLSASSSPAEPDQLPASLQLDQTGTVTVPLQSPQSHQSSQFCHSPQSTQSSHSPQSTQSTQSSHSPKSSLNSLLLSSGALTLPGTRDRNGRAVVTVCTRNTVWLNPECDSAELLRVFFYLTSTLRKEVRVLGLTVLVDARRSPPVLTLFNTFKTLQENTPGCIHTVLLLADRDVLLHMDRPLAIQVEVLTSLKSIQKHVEPRQLPVEFGGSFNLNQSSWLCFRSKVEQLTSQCEDVINFLQKSISKLESTPLPAAAEEAELLLSRYKAVMRTVLEDSQLVRLQQEGGAILSCLRREESSISVTDDYRVAVEAVAALYDEVDELLHKLVKLSNSRTEELQLIKEFRTLEQDFSEVKRWVEEEGESRLKTLDELEDSLELVNKKQQDFKDFYRTAYEYCKRGDALLRCLERWDSMSSSEILVYKDKACSFWVQLQNFFQRVDATGQRINQTVRLYNFFDQAYGWALEGMRHLAGVSMDDCTSPEKCQAVIGCLDDYRCQHPPIPDGRFQEMKKLAGELRGEQGLRQWTFAWSKCQETRKMFDRKLDTALRTRDSAHRCRSDSTHSKGSASLCRKAVSGVWGVRETTSSSSSPPQEVISSFCPANTSSPLPNTSSPTSTSSSSLSGSSTAHTPLTRRLSHSASLDESYDQVSSSSPSLLWRNSSNGLSPTSSGRRQHLRKTQSFDCPSTPEASRYGPCPRALSEPVRRGNTGVFIRGLEVSSTEAADRTLCPRIAAQGGPGPWTPGTTRTTSSIEAEPRPRGSKLRHIVEEMVMTEREYVRSLRYIIYHYFPEMERADLPQDLRGKRSVVFGNLEKLLDFHSQFFLRELEACWKHPLRVPHCFLRHQEQFGLYALYSKNKPKSDALLASHGNNFFRRKQAELGDKMDLSSYLLKPVQRMSKYALLLTDLIKEVGMAQEAELAILQAAAHMVKFQLRHGNDLLAMDAIRDCDVNLKEQGQLVRQDEFTIWSGRRKCQRHVFLFEELVLFSKPKRVERGLDVYMYKHSFKTADVGLTESTGDSGLQFEIWFRRRTSKNQTFTLQAATPDIKQAWTADIARILWTQATRNKEMRLKEMVRMGVGNKPFLDIQPSEAAISDRAIHYIMKGRGARTRASIAVSLFDHSNPFKRGPVTSEPVSSGPSSCSLLGPLNLHMYSSQSLPVTPPTDGSISTFCIEEDEQEHETSSQPSMTTESSGSSSRCLSGSTGSDSGCVSSHLQEVLPEELSPPCQSSSSSNVLRRDKKRLNGQYISSTAAPVISPATVV